MKKLLLVAALSGTALYANATDDGIRPYIGVEGTDISIDAKTVSGINGNDLYPTNLGAIGPYVGLQLNKNIAVELGYFTTSKQSKDFTLNGVNGTTKYQLSGFTGDLIGRLPVSSDERLALLGSAGVGFYHEGGSVSGPGGVIDASDNETDWRLGLGGEYNLTDHVGIRAMARYLNHIDDDFNHVVAGSLGLAYRF